jgi:uncharacterized protein (DUF885 family)
MELSELEALYENASPGPLVLTAGNTGSIEVEGDEEAFAEYESRMAAECAVALHNAFPALAEEVKQARLDGARMVEMRVLRGDILQLIKAARRALRESSKGPIEIETSELLRAALGPFSDSESSETKDEAAANPPHVHPSKQRETRDDMNAFEKNLLAAAHAYKQATVNSRIALRRGIPPTADGKKKQDQIDNKLHLALEAIKSAALHLPDDKKRVGDVWANPRGRHYRIVGFGPDRNVRIVSVKTGIEEGIVSGLLIPDNEWTLVEQGDGEEEPS